MKELREFQRYQIHSGFYKSAFVEIDGDIKVSAVILDLSAGGFSFSFSRNHADPEFDPGKFLFVRIYLDRFTINAEVEKRWSVIKKRDNEEIYTAGVSFKIMSNEDRLRLDEIIDYLRSEPSSSVYRENA